MSSSLKGSNGESMTLSRHHITYHAKGFGNGGKEDVAGVVARVEDGEDLRQRITLTRIALLGMLAVALPKKYGGEKFLTIEGEDFVWAMEVDRKHANDAVEFAAEVNDASKKASK